MNFRLVGYAVFAYLASSSILLFMVAAYSGRPPSPAPATDPDRVIEIRPYDAQPRTANPDVLEVLAGVSCPVRRFAIPRAERDAVLLIRGGHGTEYRMPRRR